MATIYRRGPRSFVWEGYHGTFTPMNRIRPGLHFASNRVGARDRLVAKSISAGAEFFPVGTRPRFVIGDPEVPGRIIRARLSVDNPIGNPRKLKSEQFMNLNDNPRSRARLRSKGYDTIFYKNIVEDPGKTSALSLDPEKVKIKDVETYVPLNRPLAKLSKRERALKALRGKALGIVGNILSVLPAVAEDHELKVQGESENYRRVKFWENMTGIDLGSQHFRRYKDI